ncbi:hypothetical protein DdX_04596 [Ditylenchus destructor]|uniref:Uncharacterized protein n=1 Tax=Ditylenchus destructor TaxID=166010 RepID=A0AAD4R7X2_9BILA|nr:hypothetical protein DdX_04596 [Ditylenchus destructor]
MSYSEFGQTISMILVLLFLGSICIDAIINRQEIKTKDLKNHMLDIKKQFASEEDKLARKLLVEESDESSTAITNPLESSAPTMSTSSGKISPFLNVISSTTSLDLVSSTSDRDASGLNETQSTASVMATEMSSDEFSTFNESTLDFTLDHSSTSSDVLNETTIAESNTTLDDTSTASSDVSYEAWLAKQHLDSSNVSVTDPDGWNEPPWGVESRLSYESNWGFVKQLRHILYECWLTYNNCEQGNPECDNDKCGRVYDTIAYFMNAAYGRFKMFSRLTGVCCERKDRGIWKGEKCRDAGSVLPYTTWTSSDCEIMYNAASNDSHISCSEAKCDEQRKDDCYSVTFNASDEKKMEQCQWYYDNCKSKRTQNDCNKRRNDCYTVLKITANQWYKCYSYAVDPCINAPSDGPKNCSWRKTIFYKDDLRITTCDKDPAQYNCAHEWLKAYVCKGPKLPSHPDYDESMIEVPSCNETSTESAAGIPLISWIWWTLFFSLLASILLQCS